MVRPDPLPSSWNSCNKDPACRFGVCDTSIYCIRSTPLAVLRGSFLRFYVLVYFVNNAPLLVTATNHNFQVHFALRGSPAMEADHFIHTVNDLLLRMSIGGSGYLCWGRGRNLIAPSERSLRTWLDLEPLLMFFICVVTTFLLTEISPGSFHVHRSLEIHAPVTPTDCWFHSGNSGIKKKKNVNSFKGKEFIISILKKILLAHGSRSNLKVTLKGWNYRKFLHICFKKYLFEFWLKEITVV